MPTNSASPASNEQLLGEIETRIMGMQYHDAAVEPGEQINLEREPERNLISAQDLVQGRTPMRTRLGCLFER